MSNKSLLNINPRGKKNFVKFVDKFYPQFENNGQFIRSAIESYTGMKYEDIIKGEW